MELLSEGDSPSRRSPPQRTPCLSCLFEQLKPTKVSRTLDVQYRTSPILGFFVSPKGAETEYGHFVYGYRCSPRWVLTGLIGSFLEILMIGTQLLDPTDYFGISSECVMFILTLLISFFFVVPCLAKRKAVVETYIVILWAIYVTRSAIQSMFDLGFDNPVSGPVRLGVYDRVVMICLQPRWIVTLFCYAVYLPVVWVVSIWQFGLNNGVAAYLIGLVIEACLCTMLAKHFESGKRAWFRANALLELRTIESEEIAKKASDLLSNILPAEFVESVAEMRDGCFIREVSADCGCFVQADIVGFSHWVDISARGSAHVSAVMNSYYCAFDTLCESLGLTKMRTVGDAFWAYSLDGCVDAVAFGVGMIETMKKVNLRIGEHLKLRVGIAGGTFYLCLKGGRHAERLCFDAFGESITDAIKIEQSVPAGCVGVNENAFQATEQFWRFEDLPEGFKGRDVVEKILKVDERGIRELRLLGDESDADADDQLTSWIDFAAAEEIEEDPEDTNPLGEDDVKQPRRKCGGCLPDDCCYLIKVWFSEVVASLFPCSKELLQEEIRFRRSCYDSTRFGHSLTFLWPLLTNFVLISLLGLTEGHIDDLWSEVTPFVVLTNFLICFETIMFILLFCLAILKRRLNILLFLSSLLLHYVVHSVSGIFIAFGYPYGSAMVFWISLCMITVSLTSPVLPPLVRIVFHVIDVVIYSVVFGFVESSRFLHPQYATLHVQSIGIFVAISAGFVLGLYSQERGLKQLYLLTSSLEKREVEIEKERRRNELLLLSFLPRDIVSRCLVDYRAVAESRQAVVGFLRIESCNLLTSENVSAYVSRLSDLHGYCDRFLYDHDCVTVKTVSEYLIFLVNGGSGMHLRRAVAAATGCLNGYHQCFSEGGDSEGGEEKEWNLKFGLAIGEFHCGVFGRTRWHFDVLGGIVNLAARLCSVVAGKGQIVVQDDNVLKCFEDAIVPQGVRLSALGEFELKGFGLMPCSEIVLTRED